MAGIKAMSPTGQYIHTLINKGEIFGKCIEQHPDAVQAGPLIEQLLNETLGLDGFVIAFYQMARIQVNTLKACIWIKDH